MSYNRLLAELFGFPVTGHINATAFDIGAIGVGVANADDRFGGVKP